MLISKNSMKKIQYRLGSINVFFRDIVKNQEILKDDGFINETRKKISLLENSFKKDGKDFIFEDTNKVFGKEINDIVELHYNLQNLQYKLIEEAKKLEKKKYDSIFYNHIIRDKKDFSIKEICFHYDCFERDGEDTDIDFILEINLNNEKIKYKLLYANNYKNYDGDEKMIYDLYCGFSGYIKPDYLKDSIILRIKNLVIRILLNGKYSFLEKII